MKIKNFFKSVKLYLGEMPKSVAIITFFYIAFIYIISISQAVTEKRVSLSFYGIFGILIFMSELDLRMITNKFFASSARAKQLFTTVPVFVTLVYIILNNLFFTVIYALTLSTEAFAQYLVILSLMGACSLICINIFRKNKLTIVSIIFFFSIIIYFSSWLKKNPDISFLSDISLPAAFVISVLLYAAGTLASLMILNFLWKKKSRVQLNQMPLVFLQNSKENN